MPNRHFLGQLQATISERLQQLNLSQHALAEKLGSHESTLSRYLSGGLPIDLAHDAAWADALALADAERDRLLDLLHLSQVSERVATLYVSSSLRCDELDQVWSECNRRVDRARMLLDTIETGKARVASTRRAAEKLVDYNDEEPEA